MQIRNNHKIKKGYDRRLTVAKREDLYYTVSRDRAEDDTPVMKIYNSIGEFAKTGYASHVALGFFDGVHLGHRAVLRDCAANKESCPAVALTFSDSPARLLGKEDVRLLTDNARKAELMEAQGIDAVIFADFLKIKDMEPEDFITLVLLGQLRAKRVSCGYNYRFGKSGRGDTRMLREIGGRLGMEVSVAQPIFCGARSVSSSAVRELLRNGDIADANRMLGYAYAIRGRIGSGNGIGSTMGYPTVNIPIAKGMAAPRFGVYASRVEIDGITYHGATNIGVHPTVGENDGPLCETFLLDRVCGELYGKDAVCVPEAFIRPEKRFADIEELRSQVGRDIEMIKHVLF